ncbi:rRNA maturation RNase YbeY [Candidatus Babeliales bacterium]|nr:rRNA maturation RNase YbeY [Candidatus Babeliales bacterium]MCF7899739.1 rRNA maturation RNase YbeY [Candidatus Babeliales bacterium]
MILIKNRLKKIKIDSNKIKKIVAQMLKSLGYENFDIGILFTTNKTIKNFNKIYRQKNKPTDILSFPYHTDLKPGQKIKIMSPDDQNLGDIIISLEFAQKDANSLKHSLLEHLKILLAHGIVHLIGYNHETDEQYKEMQKIEKNLLKIIK